MKRWFVMDVRQMKQYNVTGRDALYDLAFEISQKHRAAVYFGEDATEEELIDDLRGCGCMVTQY